MKKIISAVLVITVVINIVGFGFLNIRSSAAFVVDDAIYVFLGGVIVSLLAGAAGNAIVQKAPTLESDIQYMINNNAIQNGEVIEIYEVGGQKYFSPVNGLSSGQAELAQYLCDNLNNSDIADTLYSGFEAEYSGSDLNHGQIKAEVYKDTKNACISAFNNLINAKASAEAASGMGSSLSELGAVTYPFDFSGPLPSMTLPTTSGAVSLDMNGFHFVSPYPLYYSESFYNDENAARIHGGQYIFNSGNYYTPQQKFNAYGYQYYIMYNGKIYMRYGSSDNQMHEFTVNSLPGSLNDYNTNMWISSDGSKLLDVTGGLTIDQINNLYGGVVYYTEYKDYYDSVPWSNNDNYDLTSSDFIISELGDDITLDRSPSEDLIGSAMGLGLVSSNPTLTIDTTTGEITAADNIDLATLESLIEKLSEGQLKFEDIEGYLQSIVALLQAQGADQKTISAILQGIRSNTSSIADINAAVQSIADAMSIEAEAEIELPDVDPEAFIVNHTGLPEATTIVNSIPVFGQVKQLLNNVFDSSQYSSGAPNFKFYWDSDGDGTREVYNALDLSFLDNRIASETLSDSGRLSDSMTYRQFLHALIIFLCYVGFAIKIIKKLPSLFGASESFNEFVSSDK